MLKDEFEQLMALFHQAAEGKPVNLEEVFQHSLRMFEEMKEQIATGSPEDKIEAMRMMSEMYKQMITASKKITEASGLSEEQLSAFAENPANFSPEQWQSIQASKEQISKAGKDLVKKLQDVNKASKDPEKKIDDKGPPKGGKSGWIRS